MTPAGRRRRLRDFLTTRSDIPPGTSEFASRVGVTKAAVHSWLTGAQEPTMANVGRLAAVVGVRRCDVVAALDGDRCG